MKNYEEKRRQRVNEQQLAKAKAILYYKENHELKQEIGRLTAESTKWESKFYDEAKKVDRAIEYLELFNDNCSLIDHSIIKGALNILKGSDKE